MNTKSYVNYLDQKVVIVDCGYKVYDAVKKNSVIIRVGDNLNGKYVYVDRRPVEECSNDICFMDEEALRQYETEIKNVTASELSDEKKLEKIILLNSQFGITGKSMVELAEKECEYPLDFFDLILKDYCGKGLEK